ncbi:hypothetical protein [Aurantiacibacter rhizosphaerae]|uniref:Uncharacterized protein n=1 Tax=Aurantiacibacter rhizosphaerae TaxID=2691582 RepID=A0A844XFV6_9SPHN|nr:hypothetical protein [Aurantiacibacter rhizosphaerae]MWV28448.1 hypothetical protein [Aurantiacibacter rhizosphaerae]
MPLRRLLVLSIAGTLISGCSNSEDADMADDAARPEPVLTQAAQPTAAPDGTALVAGSWTVKEGPAGGSAVFAEDGQQPALTMSCDSASGTLSMMVASASQTPEAWRLDAGGEVARIDMAPVEGGLAAEIQPDLAIFHAFAAPGQTASLTSATGEIMQFPTHPGISRVLDACS